MAPNNLRNLLGLVKDKIALSKLSLLSKTLQIAVLRATSYHPPSAPPHPHHLATLLSLGDSSRATASILIAALIDRLHRSSNSSVALKSLLTIHHIIARGPFILKDQLSVLPVAGGRNYLNLSAFRDNSSATAWILSAWVRWYARYLETVLSTSKTLGFTVSSSSCTLDREKKEESISSVMDSDLIKDFESLIGVIEEICKVPDNLLVDRNKLLYGITELLFNDYLSTVNEILLRLSEFKERQSSLSFNDSVELACALNRLRHCKEKLGQVFTIRKSSMEMLWDLVEEMNEKLGTVKLTKSMRGERMAESTRFGGRFGKLSESVKFSSGRFELPLATLEDTAA